MNARERAQAIITDILVNHLPRIKDGLEKGYVDENQILIVYDHAVRARVLQEYDFEADAAKISAGIEHQDNLTRINAELEAEEKPVIIGTEFSPKEIIPVDAPATKLVNVPSPDAPCGILKQVEIPRKLKDEIEQGLAIIQGRSTVTDDSFFVSSLSDAKLGTNALPTRTADRDKAWVMSIDQAKKLAEHWTQVYADLAFTHVPVSDLEWQPHSDQLQCACGGLVKEFPTAIEPLLKCERCERVYTDEEEVFKVRKTEFILPQKQPDATYWSTGTLLHGHTPMATEIEINLNGRKAIVRGVNGTFNLTYERIVRMTISQQRGNVGDFTVSDDDLPMLSCTYRHRVEFGKLPGERDGSLCKGQSVVATPGMVVNCIDTGNA